jgi:hypothetical protein
MVEIEIGVLRGQFLDRRIDDSKRLVPAGIFFLARLFKSRISPAVHSPLVAFLAMTPPSSDGI